MKTLNLTEEEASALSMKIADSLEYRKKQLRQSITLIFIGSILGAILFYFNDEHRIIGKAIAVILFGLFLAFNMLIFWKLARKSISKLEQDLQKGVKVIGSSTIKSKNIFNRDVKLADGTLIYGAYVNKDWEKGDVIDYIISPSNEYLWECKNGRTVSQNDRLPL